jgi:transcriptional regulator with XRE-family HTH domain
MEAMNYNPDSIRILRLSRNLNPAEFARIVGVQRQHVYSWEGGTVPHTLSLLRIANALGLSSLDIFFVRIDYHCSNIMDSHMMQYSEKGAQR